MLNTIRNSFACLFFSGMVMSSCSTPAVIVSPNQFHNVPGTLYLAGGDTVVGQISLNTEVLFPKDIRVATQSGNLQQVHLLEVQELEVAKKMYELKHKRNHLRPSSGFYFMERLTPAGSKMNLYVHMERRQTGKSMQEYRYEPVYHLELPNEKQDRVWASDSKKLLPHFDKKMSKIVASCPALADSIKSKAPGFFYNRLNATEENRGRVLQKIVAAYNRCDNTSRP